MRTLADHPLTAGPELTPPAEPAQVTVTVMLPDLDHLPAWATVLQDWLRQSSGDQADEPRDAAGTDQPQTASAPASVPELVVNPTARTAHVVGRALRLTRQEFDLLLFLTTHSGRVFTRLQLMQQAWKGPADRNERCVDVYVRRLRVHLAGRGPKITTVYGVGYRLDDSHHATVTT
ncbi:yclJ-like transcriptional regulatory protein [Actinoplanes sp. SE50]|uniref:winged helix-turn-helix domain-containing protein n=1 Tax=unclassified Actinoplanes TaxID=2626549 RepID=UPI00023ECA08|nr:MULTISPECIES: winged helix-turn-helix domain-containing protein [unclassified Actinoplanes]AEV87087.1 yclJ-like uncharacterized transcriptional regulatory protein [Actinoplanes sp. SE50/110]ATO85485.1 yclJ-like transcriptional regulatory protein [Actinoplanes sp. SE50]SLM02897.1 two-component system response regulator [Actinoplanes sp. SE50/110]